MEARGRGGGKSQDHEGIWHTRTCNGLANAVSIHELVQINFFGGEGHFSAQFDLSVLGQDIYQSNQI